MTETTNLAFKRRFLLVSAVLLCCMLLCLVTATTAWASTIAFSPDTINESATDGATIGLTLYGDTFIDTAYNAGSHYGVAGLPDGVTVASLVYTSLTTATMTLSGTPTQPFTANASVTVAVYAAAVVAGVDVNASTFIIAPAGLSVGVYFGDDVASSPYLTSSNTLRIRVLTNTPAQVKFGSVVTIEAAGAVTTKQSGLDAEMTTDGSSYTYTVGRYPLKPGTNSLTITVTGSSKQTLKYTVNYPDVPTAGAEYYIGNVTTLSKADAFGKSVSLSFGKLNYIMTGADALADNQSFSVEVYGSPTPPGNFIAVSPAYHLTLANNAYKIGKPVTLTLKYSGLGTPDNLTIWRSVDADFSSVGVNLGGIVNQKAGTITVMIDGAISGYYGVFNGVLGAENFLDVQGDNWYYHPVSTLWVKGVMEQYYSSQDPWEYVYGVGIDNEHFGLIKAANTPVNICRGEFAFVMTRALSLTPVNPPSPTFNDISGLNDRYEQAIEAAAFNGLIRGFPDGSFEWNTALTREQAAVIIARAAGLTLVTTEATVNSALQTLYKDDWETISPWARSSVLAANKAKLMAGTSATTFGTGNLTRAEAASLVHRYMLAKKLI